MAAHIAVLAALLAGGEPTRSLAVAAPVVRLGDLLDLASAPAALRGRAARLEVIALKPGPARRLARDVVLARVRSQLPLLAPWAERHVAPGYVVAYRRPDPANGEGRCLRARSEVAADGILRSDDFASADCAGLGHGSPSYRYVPAERAVRARGPIAAGSVVPRFAGYGRTLAHAGDRVALSASSGPVTVTREVRLLQSAREGERLFARTAEGEVISAPFRGAGR